MIAEVVDRATGPLRAIGASLRAIGSSPYVSRLRGQFQALGGSLAPIGGLLKGAIAGGLAAVGVSAISAGAAFAGLLSAMNGAKDRLDELYSMSNVTGFAVQQLRQLQYVADQQNVAWETMSGAFTQMNKRLGEVRSGAGAFGKTLAKNDPAMYRALKRTRNSSEAFTVLHKRMSAMKDPAQRTAFAMKYFGKSGADIAKLTMSTKDFVAMLQRADKVRGILPDDAGEKADTLGDTLGELKLAAEGVVDAIGYQLFDAASETAGTFRDWIIINREWIATSVADTLREIGEYLREVDWVQFGRDMRDAGRWIKDTVQSLGGLKNVLYGIGAVLAAGPILSLLKIGRAVLGLGAAAAGVSTVGLLAIAGAGVAIARDWDRVGPKLREAGAALGELGSQSNSTSFIEELKNIENATKGFETSIKDALEKGILDLAAMFGDAGGQSTKAFLDGLDALPGQVGTRLVEMYAAIDAQWQGFTAQMREAASALGSAIAEGIMSPLRSAAAAIGEILAGIVGKIRGVIDMIPGLSSATKGAEDAAARRAQDHPGVGVGRGMPGKSGHSPAPDAAPSGGTPGKQSRHEIPNRPLPEYALGPRGGAQQGAAAEPVRGEAKVTVDFRNMPSGVSAQASTGGELFKSINVNRGSAMKSTA